MCLLCWHQRAALHGWGLLAEQKKSKEYCGQYAHCGAQNEHKRTFCVELTFVCFYANSINKQNPPSCPVATGAGRIQTRPRIAL
jgi:hypothetical protein